MVKLAVSVEENIGDTTKLKVQKEDSQCLLR